MQKVIKRRAVNSQVLQADLHPVMNRVYAARGIESPQELECELKHLLPFDKLANIELAVSRLYQALIKQEKILIVGDFDTDGATSTAVALQCLTAFGAQEVDFMVPNRFAEGYGLSTALVVQAQQQDVQLIVTVDNGISSHAGVAFANEAAIDVIITDHHCPAPSLPAACAIVNPNLVGDEFDSKNLAGVGVIFYVMLALRRELQETGWFAEKQIALPNMANLLDLVALGTVADVVPLDRNNRILVHHGLSRISKRKCSPGIVALLEVAKRSQQQITAADLGYAVAPRLNAAGRLQDMRLGIECLTATSLPQARLMAQQLDSLNQERRRIEADMSSQALQAIKQLELDDNPQLPMGLCLYTADWHQGVVGIIAGRIKDRYRRPVIAFAKVADDELKGSARSIKGIHIRDVLAAIASTDADLIGKFGGHAMAAGLSLHPAQYERFKSLFCAEMTQRLKPEMLENELLSDGELAVDDLQFDLAELIQRGGPWGQSFPEPLFDGRFDIIEQRIVGSKHLKLVVALPGFRQTYPAIAFNVDLEHWPNYHCESVHIAYRIDINEFNNRRDLQLIIEHITV
jgi:single-stranded-DNA-specific exonuclease